MIAEFFTNPARFPEWPEATRILIVYDPQLGNTHYSPSPDELPRNVIKRFIHAESATELPPRSFTLDQSLAMQSTVDYHFAELIAGIRTDKRNIPL